MEERSSLLQIVSAACPGASIDTFPVGKLLVVGFTHRSTKMWIALDHHPESSELEDILGCIANILVLCENCGETTLPRCHFEHRVISERMRRFLGKSGYEEFCAHAPIRGGWPKTVSACAP